MFQPVIMKHLENLVADSEWLLAYVKGCAVGTSDDVSDEAQENRRKAEGKLLLHVMIDDPTPISFSRLSKSGLLCCLEQCSLQGAKFNWANLRSLFLDCGGQIFLSFFRIWVSRAIWAIAQFFGAVLNAWKMASPISDFKQRPSEFARKIDPILIEDLFLEIVRTRGIERNVSVRRTFFLFRDRWNSPRLWICMWTSKVWTFSWQINQLRIYRSTNLSRTQR